MSRKKPVPADPNENLPALMRMLTGGYSVDEIGDWIDRVADADPLRAEQLVIELRAYYRSVGDGRKQ